MGVSDIRFHLNWLFYPRRLHGECRIKNTKQNNCYLYIFFVVRFVPKVSDDTLSFVNVYLLFLPGRFVLIFEFIMW